ncbi:MAG: TolC family protein, partial [Terriglobia bacterium]
HPEIFAAHYNALAQNQVVRESQSAYFPTMEADFTGSGADRNGRIGAGFLATSRLFNREGQGITIEQLITDSGRTPNLIASSRFQARAANENTQATRYDVLLAVDQAYFESLRDQALLKVARGTISERQVVLDQVTAMVQNKLKSKLDLSFANVSLAQAQLLEIQAENNVRISFAQLTRAMGLQNTPSFTLVQEPLPPAPPATGIGLVNQAMENRPELASLRFSRDSAYKFQRAERDLSYPTVAAVGVAGYIPAIEQLTSTLIPNHYEAAGINVQIPIFNGHLFAARREAALMKARQADENLRNMEERIARDVRVAWANADTAYRRIDVANELLNQAQLALALAQGRYNLGLSSIVALSQAQLNETQAAIQDVNAKYDYQEDNSALEYQMGMLR